MKANQVTQLIDLKDVALRLPNVWSSTVVGHIGQTRLKVLRMNELAYAEEIHDFNEGLLVIDGKLFLELSEQTVTVNAGQLYVVEAGVSHAVLPGSSGTLMIIDTAPQAA